MKRLFSFVTFTILLGITLLGAAGLSHSIQSTPYFEYHPLGTDDYIKRSDVVLVRIFQPPFFKDEMFHFNKVVPIYHGLESMKDTLFVLTHMDNPSEKYILTQTSASKNSWQILRPIHPDLYAMEQYPIDFSKQQTIIEDLDIENLYSCGSINWTEGYIYSRATSNSIESEPQQSKNQNIYKDRIENEREISIQAQEAMFDLLMFVPVYDYYMVSDILKENETIQNQFYHGVKDAIVQLEPIYHSASDFEIPCRIPLYGPKSFGKIFLNAMKNSQKIEADPQASYNKTIFTKLIIDTRATTFSPTMFPKVFNTKKELLYSHEVIPSNNRTNVTYVHYTKDPLQFRNEIWNPDLPRVDGKYALYVSALEAFGEKSSNLVISDTVYKQIIAVPENIELLKTGNVYLVVQ